MNFINKSSSESKKENCFALDLLCKLASELLNVNITVEQFYQAKQNENSLHTVNKFWSLIHALVCQNDEECNDYPNHCAKIGVLLCGYKIPSFLALPDDNSYGSLQLLHAFTFLTKSFQIEKKLCDFINSSPYRHEFISENIFNDMESGSSSPSSSSLSMLESMNIFFYKVGKLNKAIRMCNVLMTERQDLLQKVYDIRDVIGGLPKLSVLEIAMITEPFLQNSGTGFNKLLNLAKMYNDWINNSHLYFQWVNSSLRNRKSHCIPTDNQVENLTQFNEILTKYSITADERKLLSHPCGMKSSL